ncbi:hypothetical protein PT2222_160251 [Paraburkholderia tropica]
MVRFADILRRSERASVCVGERGERMVKTNGENECGIPQRNRFVCPAAHITEKIASQIIRIPIKWRKSSRARC